MNETPQSSTWDVTKLVPRPNEILRGLPLADQWEVTRRHPYYLLYWEYAGRFSRFESQAGLERAVHKVAAIILGLIGVTGDYPDPKTSADEFKNGIQPAWLNGAIAPLSYRTVLQMIITQLPPNSLKSASMFSSSYWDKATSDSTRYELMARWRHLISDDLDSFPQVPIVSFNLEAPTDEILKTVEMQVREWKKQRGTTTNRRRQDKVSEYLHVWDLREGWSDGDYDPSNEKTLKAIAKETNSVVGTVSNRYQAAFKLIVGCDYSPELWDRLFGAYKISSFGSGKLSLPRPRQSRRDGRVKIVTETDLRLGSNLSDLDLGARVQVIHTEPTGDYLDLLANIRVRIARGLENDRIISELELTDSMAPKMIDWVRQHPDEDPK